ncbi:MFS transporter [Streptomyces canus]|uniref:MFS transporter n=1 Tax=Streptomyces canus TaxID=58343 RepID=UPI00035E8EC0|nr:MFS transporter [Streptomyces canus]
MTALGLLSAKVPDLLRKRSFRRYWTGQSISLVGDQISQIALPLVAVLALHADAAHMGWLATAQLMPALLFSLPAGAWADSRAHRRRVMIATDLARAVLIASVPIAYALDALTFTQLYAVALGIGALTVLFDVCNTILFVSLIPAERYIEGNSLVNGSRAMSFVAGPSAGGLLVQLLTAPLALLADAVTYLASACCLARITPVEPPAVPPAKGHFTAGLRWIFRSRVMRATFAGSATVQFFNFIFHTLFVLYATTELGLSAGVLGSVLGVGAIGGLVGAALTGRLVRRVGVGPAVVIGFAAFPVPLLLVPLADGPDALILSLLFLAEFGSCVGAMIVDISLGSLQTALIPHALRARVNGAYRTLTHGVRPLGALAGGALGTAVGLRPTLWIATAGAVMCLVWVLPSPVPRIRELPDTSPEPAPGAPSASASASSPSSG